MADFVSTIRRISHEKFEKYERVAKGREQEVAGASAAEPIPVPVDEFTIFVYNAPATLLLMLEEEAR